VARSYALGRDFALDGTPRHFMADGELLPGYVPPDVLAKHLKERTGQVGGSGSLALQQAELVGLPSHPWLGRRLLSSP